MPQIGFGHEEEVCLLNVYQIQYKFIMRTVLLYHEIYPPLKFQVSSDFILFEKHWVKTSTEANNGLYLKSFEAESVLLCFSTQLLN